MKNIKPVIGHYVEEYLEKLIMQVEGSDADRSFKGPRMGRGAKEVRSIVEILMRSLNTGTCMNEIQGEEIKKAILYDRRADATLAKELIERVNGFRLDCWNCIRPDCTMRNPRWPIKRIKKKL